MIAIAFVVAIAVATITLASILEGLVLSVMWGWFLVPLGAPKIGVALAIGVSLIVGMLTHQHSKSEDGEWVEKIVGAFLGPLLILCIGWIVHKFI